MWRRVIPIALCLIALSSSAADVRVRVHAYGTARECLADASVVAMEDGGGRRTAAVAADGIARLTIPDSGSWTLSVTRKGCWSDRRPATAGEVELQLFKAGVVSGTFEAAKVSTPSTMIGTVYLHGGLDSIAEQPPDRLAVSTDCDLSDWRWRCVVPAETPIDLRLDVSGHASIHYWDVVASAAEARELEPQPLRRGASLSGWVQTQNELPLSGALVTLFPLAEQDRIGRRDVNVASMRTARTDRRGFFQIAGLEPARYRLVSESAGVSPLVVPEIDVRGGGLALQRPLRHDPAAEAEVIVTPPADRHGRPWKVELAEAVPLYPGRRPGKTARSVDSEGRMTAPNLRADVYDVTIQDAAGTVVHRAELDLFGGGRKTLQLSVQPVQLRGVVRAGGAAVKADVQLGSGPRDQVRLTTDSDGRFETALPRKGRWSAVVLHPPGPRGARLEAEPVVIPEELTAGDTHEVVIELPGGRIHGEVVAADGRATKAVVYVNRNGRLRAQQMTEDDGAFDIIGLAPGTYQVEAQTAAGGTGRAVEITIEEGDSRELRITTEPYALFSGQVFTPDGRPASGARIMFSPNGGRSWTDMITDPRGRFEQRVNRTYDLVPVLVLTYEYPAAMLHVRAGEPARIDLRPDGGILRFDGRRAFIHSARGVRAATTFFHFPPPWGRYDGGVFLEAGHYVVCPDLATTACRTVTVSAGSDQTISFEQQPEGTTR